MSLRIPRFSWFTSTSTCPQHLARKEEFAAQCRPPRRPRARAPSPSSASSGDPPSLSNKFLIVLVSELMVIFSDGKTNHPKFKQDKFLIVSVMCFSERGLKRIVMTDVSHLDSHIRAQETTQCLERQQDKLTPTPSCFGPSSPRIMTSGYHLSRALTSPPTSSFQVLFENCK